MESGILNRKALALVLPFVLVRWLIIAGIEFVRLPNYQGIMLFNGDNVFDNTTGRLTFYHAQFVHSFYPLTYVLSRIFFLVVNQPLISEFVMPMAVTACLLYAVLSLALSLLPQGHGMALYAVCLFAFLATEFSQLSFESIAIWALLVLVVVEIGRPRQGRKATLISMLLLSAIILSNDGIVTYMALFFYALIGVFSPQSRRTNFFLLLFGGLSQLLYFNVIAFSGPIYYSTYLLVVSSLLSSLMNPNSSMFGTHISSLGLPLFQSIGLVAANVVFYMAIPGILVYFAYRERIDTMRLGPAIILYSAGLALRVANALIPNINYVSALYGYILFGFVPLGVLAALDARKPSPITSVPRSTRHSYQATSLLIVAGTVFLLWFSATPMIPTGKIVSSSDPRANEINLLMAQFYGIQYGKGPLIGDIGDSNYFMIDWSLAGPPLTVLFTIPGQYFVQLPPNYAGDVFYSNGITVIVN